MRAEPARVPDRRRGSAVLSTLALLAVVSVSCAVLAVTARATASRARAQSAADAVALAAVVDREVATRVATANGATVQSIVVDGPELEVRVVRDGVRAVARARVTCRGGCPGIP